MMNEEPTSELNSEHRRLLTNVRQALRNRPEEFDQETYGIGAITCHAPACVAGYLVASEPKLVQELRERFDNRPLPPVAESPQEIGNEIQKIARRALGLRTVPLLFQSNWPLDWLQGDAQPKKHACHRDSLEGWFIPSADEAAAIIDRILDGTILNALEPMVESHNPG